MGKVKLCFNDGDYFEKWLSIDLPLTYRLVYIWVSDKFAYSELLFNLSTSKSKPQGGKSTDSKGKKSLEVKWNRITANDNNWTEKIAQENLDESEIEDLTDIRNEFSECERSVDRYTTEVNSSSLHSLGYFQVFSTG